MFRKVIVAVIVALTMIGCNSTSSSNRGAEPVEPTPVQPVYPVYPDPEPVPPEPEEPEVSIPSAGVGSIKGNMDCGGGTITTNYSFGNVSEDDKSFIIQYQRNGALEDLTYPSASTTGSRMLVKDIYYARANDDERDAFWVVTISFQTPTETYNLVTATLKQPQCIQEDDNLTAIITNYEVK